MFSIKHKLDGTLFYLLEPNHYFVGRKDCSIQIENDASVSRKHAVIEVDSQHATVKDCGSKYKTYINGKRVDTEDGSTLKDGDEIQFGALRSKFVFSVTKIKTTGSRLSAEQSRQLATVVGALNGTVIDCWNSDCTHLTVQEIMLSLKVLNCLVDEKPMVNLAYWEKYFENTRKNKPPPPAEKYRPPMAEALLNSISFEPDSRRKKLFEGKVFIFTTEKAKLKMKETIEKSGGSCISWQASPLSLNDVKKSSDEHVIIHTDDPKPKTLNALIDYFKTQGKRTIPIQEIAMAIVLCSCEKDCNPSFNKAHQVFNAEKSQKSTQNLELAGASESQYLTASEEVRATEIVVPETVEADLDALYVLKDKGSVNNKDGANSKDEYTKERRLEVGNDAENINPFKKIKLENPEEITSPIEEDMSQPGMETTHITLSESGHHNLEVSSKLVNGHGKRKSDDTDGNPTKKGKVFNPFTAIASTSAAKSTADPVNPFKAIKSKVSAAINKSKQDNPFKSISITQKNKENLNTTDAINITQQSQNVTKPTNNPFTSSAKSRDKENIEGKIKNMTRDIFSSTQINERMLSDSLRNIDVSRIGNVTFSGEWLSKETCKDENDNVQREMDPEMKSFCNSFKNTMVIKKMANYIKKEVKSAFITTDQTDGSCLQSQGFKKFRKVRPLHPQTTVILQKDLVRQGGDGPQGAVYLNDSDSSLEMNNQRTQRRFMF